MKIALLGYGKMGKEIEKIALSRNHTIILKIDIDNLDEKTVENLQKADVAIDFSNPSSAYDNIKICFEAGVPIVCGTTGWLDKHDEVVDYCKANEKTFFYASNFSVGVNLFFHFNKRLAQVMNNYDDYTPEMEEIHHIHKLDAPSGTAITLAEDLIENHEGIDKWELNETTSKKSLKINAVREGEVPGTHIVSYKSDIDCIEIKHVAHNRKGFATGAVLAAEFSKDRIGVYSMHDLMQLD